VRGILPDILQTNKMMMMMMMMAEATRLVNDVHSFLTSGWQASPSKCLLSP
jgi:hypothetical protein